jgi:hypothetical protein
VIARWNPFSRGREHLPVKPFLAASVGPVFGSGSRSLVIAGATHFGSTRETTMGGHVGGGVDLHLARPFAIGLHGGYYWMLDFSQPVGLRSNYSGPQFAVSLGWMFGRGRAPN